VYVKRPSGGARVEATILAVDEAVDVALLEAPGIAAAPVEFQAAARLGDQVWVVSFPWGRRETVVRGIVSQIAADPASAALPLRGPVALIDATVSFGTSGAGVFDARTGRLVGIVRGYRTAKVALPGSQGHALELPIAGETTVVPTTTILCLLAARAIGTDATALRALASMRRPAAPPEMRKRADGPSPVPPPEFAGCLTAAPA
jgi:S1-C subfamily serine protease